MAITTVRQMLTDAVTILNGLTTNPDLSTAQQNSCATAASVCTTVIGDLNAQNIIANAGRRNADVTNLRDQCITPMIAIDNSATGKQQTEPLVYNALDRISDARFLINLQVPSDDVTY